MALFPKIQSPCPYKNNLAAIMDGDVCRMCKRQVFELTDMNDAQRVAFLQSCKTEVCVSYKMPVRAALAAGVIATASVAFPIAAAACESTQEMVVTVGGIKDPANVQYHTDKSADSLPPLPVVYDDGK